MGPPPATSTTGWEQVLQHLTLFSVIVEFGDYNGPAVYMFLIIFSVLQLNFLKLKL